MERNDYYDGDDDNKNLTEFGSLFIYVITQELNGQLQDQH
jgi:hypothetical protein